jgi:uncharacterized tellurite resistance protein B-like protein
MSIADLGNVLKIFGGSELSDDEHKALYQEVLLMVLGRASSSDSNIQPVEIETIQQMVQRETGNEITSQDVRKAGRTELYETTPLAKYLASAGKKLTTPERIKVIELLAEVVKSDTEVSVLEIDFFNMVSNSLHATPAEIIGLTSD